MGVKKILIVDWDVHHGNGTQHIFEKDADVLFFSIHRHDGGFFYPNSGFMDEVGKENGKGFTVNVPWSFCEMGDAEYVAAFERILIPIATEFQPELVLVSSGFDCAKGDPIGRMKVTPAGFAKMTEIVCKIGKGRVVLVLEGGYNLEALSQSAAWCIRVLLGERAPDILDKDPHQIAESQIEDVIRVHKNYWSCFKNVEITQETPEHILQFYKAITMQILLSKQKNFNFGLDSDSYSDNDLSEVENNNDISGNVPMIIHQSITTQIISSREYKDNE
eukprot:TRINITY_DN2334_c0_g1_i2.p1 TRINITY_DN2334_c0_g1~~TRINITY_DN2334_c0_g1_i2.p1  ORF type:complete len:276 (-),score=51.83 TRINITY_DN2334_c0_g1_i2:135-962(-)